MGEGYDDDDKSIATTALNELLQSFWSQNGWLYILRRIWDGQKLGIT